MTKKRKVWYVVQVITLTRRKTRKGGLKDWHLKVGGGKKLLGEGSRSRDEDGQTLPTKYKLSFGKRVIKRLTARRVGKAMS